MGCKASKHAGTASQVPPQQHEISAQNTMPQPMDLSEKEPASTTAADVAREGSKKLTIIHFNDVYNIEAREQDPVGGAARFVTKVKEYAKEQPLILFSGDAFNPSLMSAITKGEQMVPILNEIGVHAAAVGNHDLDFGVERMEELISGCNFPWLMANVVDVDDKEPLGGSITHTLIEHAGVKVGLVGLVEHEWMETLSQVDPSMVAYTDFVTEGKRLAAELREQGAEIVIALTHMRMPNDERLSVECPEIDIILGGHDHHYEVVDASAEGRPLVFNSGTDFRDFSVIRLGLPDVRDGSVKPSARHEHVEITKDIAEHEETAAVVAEYESLVGAEMSKNIGHTLTELDGRFPVIRTGETNVGNFTCDVWREATKADAVIVNSGTFRSDMLHPVGDLTYKDVFAILPMMEDTVLLEVTGEDILGALENGVSMYPKLEGRFPQVAGIRFEFDSRNDAGSRVIRDSVTVGGIPISVTGKYKLATKDYLYQGKDGYDMLKEAKLLVPPDDGQFLPTIVRNHFDHLATLNAHIQGGRLSLDATALSDDKLALPETKRPVLFKRSSSKFAAAAINKVLAEVEDLGAIDEEAETDGASHPAGGCGAGSGMAKIAEGAEADVGAMPNDAVGLHAAVDGQVGASAVGETDKVPLFKVPTARTAARTAKLGLVVKDRANNRYCIAPRADGRIIDVAANHDS